MGVDIQDKRGRESIISLLILYHVVISYQFHCDGVGVVYPRPGVVLVVGNYCLLKWGGVLL